MNNNICETNNFLLSFLNKCGLNIKSLELIDNFELERDTLLNLNIYKNIQADIPELKKYLSSSMFTSVQKNANNQQKFPLINLVRQILKRMGYDLTPKRICNGYDENGKKNIKDYLVFKQLNLLCKKKKLCPLLYQIHKGVDFQRADEAYQQPYTE